MEAETEEQEGYLVRALAVWLAIAYLESVHGALRTTLLAPQVGDLRARQIAVLISSMLIVAIALLSIRWIHAGTNRKRLWVGVMWLALTLSFEVITGRFLLGHSWDELAADYRVQDGALMPFGRMVLVVSPLIAAKLRGL